MANECKIEFYFKRDVIENLLKIHPNAKGIIISQEIVKEKPKGAENYVNVVRIKARADVDTATMSKALDGGQEALPPVDGCPFPPGCNE
jgi:hypothetical protein